MTTFGPDGDKSYVGLEQRLCIVCATPYDTGTILLDRRLRNSLHHHELTGWGLCPEHEQRHQEGYIALVGVANKGTGKTLTLETADRTGVICHLRREVARDIFGPDFPVERPMVFVDPEVIQRLEALAPPAE